MLVNEAKGSRREGLCWFLSVYQFWYAFGADPSVSALESYGEEGCFSVGLVAGEASSLAKFTFACFVHFVLACSHVP